MELAFLSGGLTILLDNRAGRPAGVSDIFQIFERGLQGKWENGGFTINTLSGRFFPLLFLVISVGVGV